jgi:hypothetical protein
MSPTISMRATEAGIVLGTAPYMAPEQARRVFSPYGARPYDPAPNGTFLVVRGDQPDEERDVIVVVVNWHEELKQRLPVR